ncbi:hypothetical protein JEZ13_07400 [bacterium]|nr:hypothetical protein [bacterium]
MKELATHPKYLVDIRNRPLLPDSGHPCPHQAFQAWTILAPEERNRKPQKFRSSGAMSQYIFVKTMKLLLQKNLHSSPVICSFSEVLSKLYSTIRVKNIELMRKREIKE